ncbi:ATP-binding protein [Deinococcus sp.]|uniref:ATP-binding protein n=1 Tax=Deinococcus sp. TaxID=47478 RepID=UPI0025F4CF88|nr:ATP-binding protein [Deinococcus sp.]
MYLRLLEPAIREALTDTPVVMIVGARQVGKSTLAGALSPHRYTLDDLTTLAAARSDPVGFVQRLPDGALIDEVQRVPELLLSIKASIDRDRRPGRFLLTGSANVLTLPRVADSLAGRMSVHHLWPLSQGELEGGQRENFVDKIFAKAWPHGFPLHDLEERVLRGGYPEVITRSARRRDAWFADYLRTLMERDVRDLSRISGVSELPRLLTLLADRSGNLLNTSDLARDAGLNNVTLSRYTDLLRALYLVYTLPAWATNHSKRLIKAPKVMLADSGLCAHLLGQTAASLEQRRSGFGALLETFVVGELQRLLGWSEVAATLHHYRTASGQEVDAVIEARGGQVVGVEVKASATVSERDFKGLRALEEDAGERFYRGVVLYTGDRAVPFGERLMALPVSALWKAQSNPQIEMGIVGA